MSSPHSAAWLEDRLEELLEACLSSRRTAAALVPDLAALGRPQQDFVMHWASVVARSSAELAYQFAAAAPRALALLGESGAEAWLVAAMDVFDRESMYAASAALKDLSRFARTWDAQAQAVRFEESARVLELFLCGLSGRRLRVDAGDEPWTDTETVYLPREVSLFAERNRNFLVYKAMTALAWAQARFDTFSRDLPAAIAECTHPARARSWLAFLEAVRLGAKLERTLPGLARDLHALQRPAPDATVQAALAPLLVPDATISETLAVLNALDLAQAPPAWPYVVRLHPERVQEVRAARIARERDALRRVLAEMRDTLPDDARAAGTGRFEARLSDAGERAERGVELLLDGTFVIPPADAVNLIQSILQDLGGLPPEYLEPAGAGAYVPHFGPAAATDEGAAEVEAGAAVYDEWDFARRHYRRGWCVLRSRDVHPGDPAFVWRALERYRPQIASLKRTFEALRGEDRLHRREPHGDGIDLDAAVAGLADAAAGRELPERLFVRRHRAERSIAVMFLVDMSGSTKGWINDAEREALVLLCEALEVLGDRYAIYGFSGMTRKRC